MGVDVSGLLVVKALRPNFQNICEGIVSSLATLSLCRPQKTNALCPWVKLRYPNGGYTFLPSSEGRTVPFEKAPLICKS